MSSNGAQVSGDYAELIASLCNQYPTLRYLHKSILHQQLYPNPKPAGRAAVLEFSSSDFELIEFTSPKNLSEYLRKERPRKRRLFLLEDLDCDFVEAYGSGLLIEPQVFAEHHRPVRYDWWKQEYSTALPLLSSYSFDQRFHLRYFEIILIDSTLADRIPERILLCDSIVKRQIEWFDDRPHNGHLVANVQRTVSFWNKGYDDNTWDALLITDPPIGRSASRMMEHTTLLHNEVQCFELYPESGHQSIPNSFLGGYMGFNPWPSHLTSLSDIKDSFTTGPSKGTNRTSMLDDVVHYFHQCNLKRNLQTYSIDPIDCTIIARRIVLANWGALMHYLQRQLIGIENEDVTKRFTELDQTLALWSQRWLIFKGYVTHSMEQLAIPPSEASPWYFHAGQTPHQRVESYPGEIRDWQFIDSHIAQYSTRASQILPFFNAVYQSRELKNTIRVLETLQDVTKAAALGSKSINRLTKLGAFFLPLSLASGMLSVTGSFTPGHANYWVYWAISIPLVIVVFAIIYLPDILNPSNQTKYEMEELLIV